MIAFVEVDRWEGRVAEVESEPPPTFMWADMLAPMIALVMLGVVANRV